MNVPGEPLPSLLDLLLGAIGPWPAARSPAPDTRHYSLARDAIASLCTVLPDGPLAVPALICAEALEGLPAINRRTVYYRLKPDLTPDWSDIERLTPRPVALLIVHYFGFESGTAAATAWCRDRGLTLIHDRAHCLRRFSPLHGRERDRSDGLWPSRLSMKSEVRVEGPPTDTPPTFSIYSIRKHLPVPSGAHLIAETPAAAETLSALPQRRGGLGLLPALRQTAARAVFKTGSARARLLLAPILSDEHNLRASAPARGEDTLASRITARLLSPENLTSIRERRRANYDRLARELTGQARLRPLYPALPPDATPWGLPLIADTASGRDSLLETLLADGIGAWTWPSLPRDVDTASYPFEGRLAGETILLPVHQDLTAAQLQYVADTVTAWSLT